MSAGPHMAGHALRSGLVIVFGPEDELRLGEARYGIDREQPALLTPDGRRLSLAEDAVVELVPGLLVRQTERAGAFALMFGGRNDIPILRRRAGSPP